MEFLASHNGLDSLPKKEFVVHHSHLSVSTSCLSVHIFLRTLSLLLYNEVKLKLIFLSIYMKLALKYRQQVSPDVLGLKRTIVLHVLLMVMWQ